MNMNNISAMPSQADPSSNTSLPIAILALIGMIGFYFYLKPSALNGHEYEQISQFIEINQLALNTVIFAALFDILWMSSLIKKKFKVDKKKVSSKSTGLDWKKLKKYSGWLGLSILAGSLSSLYLFSLTQLSLLPYLLKSILVHWNLVASISVSFSLLGVALITEKVLLWLKIDSSYFFSKNKLPIVLPIQDGVVIGAIHEEKSSLYNEIKVVPEWVYLGFKSLTGNLFITGSIGAGKSQILLQILKQILTRFKQSPAILAIDPKRTFVRNFKSIVEERGLTEKLLWVSLDGKVKFNPIWRPEMLKNSNFTTVANSLKLATANFLGGSGDSRFWEQSSFNLLKNSLIFCAAKHEYFTFKDLYKALVQARDEGLAGELVDCLNTKKWDEEEADNIRMAIAYFNDEFSQMDQKIRTSILATATSFLNEFLEYRVSKILSPTKEEITITQMKDVIRQGKIICIYIENDSLSRSIGTLFKLLFQEAVLDRTTDHDLNEAPYAVIVMDEYQDVATSGGGAGLGDDRYLAKGREAKSITIAATQSVSSLENAIRSEPATREILQNFRSRIFGNTTDPKTIRLFQEPHGTVDRERQSHSFSESAQNSRSDILSGSGGMESNRGSVSESVSTHYSPEYPVTGREFARLRAFEAFAQIFDGLDTRFEKLFLKPYFLKDMRTPHKQLMDSMKDAAKIPGMLTLLLLCSSLFHASSFADILYPNICSVMKSPQATECMEMQVSGCMCGFPPHPCAQISYYVPQTFVEAWPEAGTTYFSKHPAAAQLKASSAGIKLPFGVDDEQGNFSFHAHAISVPMAGTVFSTLACGGGRSEKVCFDLLSEDLGSSWTTGSADLIQPQFLAWQLSPKVCLLKGAIEGVAGGTVPSVGSDSGGCSFPQKLPKYPPSPREACNGWGMFLPRSGIYQGASRAAAALMIASRLKSIGTEVSHSIPGDIDEKWQMISPQSSSCFREGQNVGFLETIKGVHEEKRLLGKLNGYLFTVWKKTSCCQEIPYAASTELAAQAIKASCSATSFGGI